MEKTVQFDTKYCSLIDTPSPPTVDVSIWIRLTSTFCTVGHSTRFRLFLSVCTTNLSFSLLWPSFSRKTQCCFLRLVSFGTTNVTAPRTYSHWCAKKAFFPATVAANNMRQREHCLNALPTSTPTWTTLMAPFVFLCMAPKDSSMMLILLPNRYYSCLSFLFFFSIVTLICFFPFIVICPHIFATYVINVQIFLLSTYCWFLLLYICKTSKPRVTTTCNCFNEIATLCRPFLVRPFLSFIFSNILYNIFLSTLYIFLTCIAYRTNFSQFC